MAKSGLSITILPNFVTYEKFSVVVCSSHSVRKIGCRWGAALRLFRNKREVTITCFKVLNQPDHCKLGGRKLKQSRFWRGLRLSLEPPSADSLPWSQMKLWIRYLISSIPTSRDERSQYLIAIPFRTRKWKKELTEKKAVSCVSFDLLEIPHSLHKSFRNW